MFDRSTKFIAREFSRGEKTCIRQDVKRFEKIGRDHGCATLDNYADFVTERTRRDDEGFLTQKSFELFRGLGAYFGHQLLQNTTLSRIACDVQPKGSHGHLTAAIAEANPGWLVADIHLNQYVIVPYLIVECVFPTSPWLDSLDDIFDQIIDWNHGYLSLEDIATIWVFGHDREPADNLAA